METSELIKKELASISQAGRNGSILDLACGSGRIGFYLTKLGLSVVFADRRQSVLDDIALTLDGDELATFWNVDFEQPGCHPLAQKAYAVILIFRYLHRALFPDVKAAVEPGGLIVYETFTTDQARFGRPYNSDFLLRPGELDTTFSNWTIVHSFEGITYCETSGREQAIAQIVARKPIL